MRSSDALDGKDFSKLRSNNDNLLYRGGKTEGKKARRDVDETKMYLHNFHPKSQNGSDVWKIARNCEEWKDVIIHGSPQISNDDD